jgi:hypothetical protein
VLEHDRLLDFDSRADFACFVCQRAGLSCVIGERQTWPVGGHELTVELQLDKRAMNVLFVRAGWPLSPELRHRRSLCLAEVYAITITDEIRAFNKPELARFKAMALIEAGIIEPARVRLPPLAPDAPAAADETWNLIGEVVTIRATLGDTGPMPLSAPWLAALNGTDQNVIRAGKLWLERRRHIVRTGHIRGRFGRDTVLWAVTGFTGEQWQ